MNPRDVHDDGQDLLPFKEEHDGCKALSIHAYNKSVVWKSSKRCDKHYGHRINS